MVNLLGEETSTGETIYEGLPECLAMEGLCAPVRKEDPKPFRKMGHVTIVDSDAAKARKGELCKDN